MDLYGMGNCRPFTSEQLCGSCGEVPVLMLEVLYGKKQDQAEELPSVLLRYDSMVFIMVVPSH